MLSVMTTSFGGRINSVEGTDKRAPWRGGGDGQGPRRHAGLHEAHTNTEAMNRNTTKTMKNATKAAYNSDKQRKKIKR